MKKLYIKTNGCQMNVYDSSKMADVLAKSHGLESTDSLDDADVILLNTCSIRDKAQEKVFSQLGQWREYKKANPHVIIGVGGCVASQEGADILKRAPYVDLVFGPQTLHRLPALLTERLANKKSVVDISFPEIEKFDHLPAPRAEGPIAFVSIMEGCSKYCSFCVVPYTRGEEISRPFDDVLAECYLLVNQGVREINLLGQNVNDYRGTMASGEIADLALLIQYLSAMDGLGRIRFTTSHPLAFSDNLISAFAEVPILANHLHLPVQSGSDRILALMKRGYTALEFKSKIRKLRKVRPDVRLSTDIIVGFPGETEEEFEYLLDFIERTRFERLGVFTYSQEEGSRAAKMEGQLPQKVKQARYKKAMKLQQRIAAEQSAAQVGKTLRALVDQPLVARGEVDAPDIDGRILLKKPAPVGEFVNVRITGTQVYDLVGEVE